MHPDTEFRLKLFMKMKNFRGPTPNRIQRKIFKNLNSSTGYSDDDGVTVTCEVVTQCFEEETNRIYFNSGLRLTDDQYF